ncbi:MAG: class I SAM-dependent methyltransferase [Candidatus Obscuribacterales bacterium]|nr:class I SAM-dependent methyltransferase [Steroidobacteraceae bacterium]
MSITNLAISWTEQGLVPDGVVRAAIRRLCKQRLVDIQAGDAEAASTQGEQFVAAMLSAPIALVPHKANDQHYEVPAAFYEHSLGVHRKYSCCYWPTNVAILDDAEAAALAMTCEHAGLSDGIDILELGCGWGSLTLWMAKNYPNARITAVSNSHSQRDYIVAEAARRSLRNVTVLTHDMNVFTTEACFDRIVSVEMFEHMRNWRVLFERVHNWLKPGGCFFMHVFVHRSTPYAFATRDASDWMSEHFFTGGMMPSDDLALRFQERMRLLHRWRWDGTHYEKTANAWLAKLDSNRDAVMPILTIAYGADAAQQWLQRWRLFYMACAELFGYNKGQEWWVSHYLFERNA